MLYRLRAQEAEVALDFAAAEADWKNYAANATDRYSAQIELADFYHRQIRPQDEIAALTAAAAAKDDPLQPATAQQGWHAFERMGCRGGAGSPSGIGCRTGLPRVGCALPQGKRPRGAG